MGYRALIGLVVFGFSHRGIDGGLIGIDDCRVVFVGAYYQFVEFILHTLLGVITNVPLIVWRARSC